MRSALFLHGLKAWLLWTGAFSLPSVCSQIAMAQPDTRPALLREHPRREANDPILNFNNMDGWAIQSRNIEASYERSAERQLWGRFTGRLRLGGGGPGSVIRFRPERPVTIPRLFNRVSFWVHLDPTPPGARVVNEPSIHILFGDKTGRPFEVAMRLGRTPGWQYHSVPVQAPRESGLTLQGFRFEGLGSPGTRRDLFFDSLAVFSEQRKRIRLERGPARPLTLLTGQLPGRNNTRDPANRLDFPASPSGAVPAEDESLAVAFGGRDPQQLQGESTYELHATTTPAPNANGNLPPSTFHLRAEGSPQTSIVYTIDLTRGLAGIRAKWNDHNLGPLLRQASITSIDGSAGDKALKLLSAHRTDKRLRALYENGLSLEFNTRRRGLDIHVTYQGGRANRLQLGPVSDASKTTTLPLCRLAPGDDLTVHLLHAGGRPMLATAFLDPFLSNATRLETDAAHYDTLMDGSRNDLFERIVLRISPQLADLLPGPSARPAPKREEVSRALWLGNSGTPHTGLPGVRQNAVLSPDIWRGDAGLSCLLCEPKVGSTSLRNQLAQARSRQLHLALPVDLTRMHPLQPDWSENNLARTGSGAWMPRLEGTFLGKSLYYPVVATNLVQRIARKMSPDLVYALGLAELPPGKAVDMDERLRGNGSHSQDFFDRGQALNNIRRTAERPVLAPGGGEWRFAGLVDGFDLTELNGPRPFRPLFARSRVVPNSVVYAPPAQGNRAAWDATSVAYGLHPRVSAQEDPRSARRAAYHLLPLQQRTAHLAVRQLAYHNGANGFQSTAEALSDRTIERSQIRLHLENNTTVWVNGHSQAWEIFADGLRFSLPPNGWCAKGPELFALRAEQNGGVFDYLEVPGLRFFDPRDRSVRFRGASGSRSFVEIQGRRLDF